MLGALLIAALAMGELPAVAEPADVATPTASAATAAAAHETADDWYGAPATVADGISLVMLEAGWGAKNERVFFLGVAGYLLAGPIGHLAHLRGDRALGSLGLRVLAAGLGYGAMFAEFYFNRGCDSEGGPPCYAPITGLVIGGAVMLGAAILDDVWLAKDRVESPPRSAVNWRPSVIVTPQLGLFSVAGRF